MTSERESEQGGWSILWIVLCFLVLVLYRTAKTRAGPQKKARWTPPELKQEQVLYCTFCKTYLLHQEAVQEHARRKHREGQNRWFEVVPLKTLT